MTTPPKIGGPSFTGGLGGTGSAIPNTPTQGFYYNMQQGDTWPSLAQLAYGDPSLWQDLAYANPGKQAKKGERVFVPKRQDLGGVGTDPGAGARRILDDGRPAPDGTLPQGDPALTGDLNAARTAANVGNTGAPRMDDHGGPLLPDENVHGQGGGGGTTATGGVARRRWRGDVFKAEGSAEYKGEHLQASAEGQVTALSAQGEAKAGWGFRSGRMEKKGATSFEERRYGISEYKGPMFMAEAGARGRVELVGAQGKAEASYGNDVIGGRTSVAGEAWVGAEVGANARIGVSKHGLDVTAGVDAFAGAKIRGKIQQDVSVAGERLGSVGARAEGWAGVGVTAKGYVNVGKAEDGRYHVKFGGKVGAALGLGGCIRADIDVDITGVVNVAKKTGQAIGGAAQAVGDAVADGYHTVKGALDRGANAVVNGVESAGRAVGDAVSKGWGKVKSMFW